MVWKVWPCLVLGGVLWGGVCGAPPVSAAEPAWLTKVTQRVMIEKDLAHEGSFDPYLNQIQLVHATVEKGDWVGTFRGMNQLMALLEAGAGGIPRKTADDLWTYCYEVVPHDLHSEEVHVKAIGREAYQRMRAHELNERWQSSREQLD